MKRDVVGLDGKKKGDIELPLQFNEPVRKDLIKRAVQAIQSHNIQPYGSDPRAGTKQGKATTKNRHRYGTTYNRGVSRVKRKRLWRRGSRFGWVAAFIANATKGRKAFPPQVEKVWSKKINKKENRKAIRSALAAIAIKEFVEARGHKVTELKALPIIIDDKFQALTKTKDVQKTLENLKLKEELARVKEKKIRAGKGTMRGRKYIRKKGPLIVVKETCPAVKAAKNIAGVDIVSVQKLNAELLAPGTDIGRLTIWTKGAMETLGKEGLFR